MSEVTLSGCTTRPLAAYLKACGVLRLLATQKDASLRGAWRDGVFTLYGALDADIVRDFFLREYQPTPIVTPWNGGSGFYATKDTAGQRLQSILQSDAPRLAMYREVITEIQQWREFVSLNTGDVSKKAVLEKKDALLQRCRSTLPEVCLPWLDAACALGEDKAFYAPLLGTGGNEGNLEYANTFMGCVATLFLHTPPEQQAAWLDAALFGVATSALPLGKVGQFDPGGAGGRNQCSGKTSFYHEDSRFNPWDFVLALEGALLFAAALVRRSLDDQGSLSAPFCSTTPLAAGFASAALQDKGRGEVWMPLWEQPATLRELRRLLGEGRATLQGRQARDGLEFARAAATLGVDRGINGFERYSFLERRGQSHVALPSGHVPVDWRPRVELLEPVARYLQLPVQRREEPASLALARRQCVQTVYACTQIPDAPHFIAVSRALARLDALPGLPGLLACPCYPLEIDWLDACDDGSPEVRLAAALASLRPQGKLGPLRAHLAPVAPARPGQWSDSTGQYVPWRGGVLEGLGRIALRRLMEAQRLGVEPWRAGIALAPADMLPLLEGRVDMALLGDLTRAFSLIRFPRDGGIRWREPVRQGRLPWALALLKLLHVHWPAGTQGGIDPARLRPETRMATLVQAGRLAEACEHAARRLRVAGAAGYAPSSYVEAVRGLPAPETLACLLVPLRLKPLLRLYAETPAQP